MGGSCGDNCAKCMLYIFNTIFLITGAVLLGITLWVRLDENVWDLLNLLTTDDNDRHIEWGTYILMGVGALILISGIIGCCGACWENRCILTTFCILMVIVMVAEVASAILVIIFRGRVKDEVIEKLENNFERDYAYQNDEWSDFASGQNIAQFTFKCCGIRGQSDYSPALMNSGKVDTTRGPFCRVNGNGQFLPATCFKIDDGDNKLPDDLECSNVHIDQPYMDGCRDDILDFFEQYALLYIILSLVFAGLEVFGLVFAICLCRGK